MGEPEFEHGGSDCKALSSSHTTLQGPQTQPPAQTNRWHKWGRQAGTAWGRLGEEEPLLSSSCHCHVGSHVLCSQIFSFSEKMPNIFIFMWSQLQILNLPPKNFGSRGLLKHCAVSTEHPWAHYAVTSAKNDSVSLGEGPAQGLVGSAAGTLGSNHWCLPDCSTALYCGPRSRRNPTQTWWIFYLQRFYRGLRRESFEFSQTSHKIPSILSYSSRSWHTYTPHRQ